MHNYNGNSTDPPVPPRRTKRKNKSASIVSSVTRSDATETTNDDARSRQKCPLQPPLSEKCRWNESRSVENRDPQCDIAASCSKTESVNERFHRENCNADIATDVIEKNFPRSRDDDTISAREIPPRIDKANDDLVPAESAALKPPFLPFPDIALPKRRTLDKYPPLFFTLHDFEDVMSAAWDGDKSASSATLENKTSTAQILDDEDDISFRVTTTNLPFGKCLGRWKDSFDNDEFIEKLDYYRLDNNKNKSDRTNVKRLSNYDSSDNDYRTGTKVRFAIDSSPSKHNGNIKFGVPSDNLQSCESIFDNEKFNKQSIASFAKLSEIREEFTDVKDCGDNLRDKLCASSAEKRNTTREYDPFMITDTNKVDMKLKTIPQTHYDNINDEKIHKEDSNFISRNERVSNENLRIGNENMTSTITKEIIMNDEYAVIDQSGMLDSSKITASVCCFTDKSLKAVCSNAEEANAAKITHKSIHQEEEISLKKSGDDIKEKCIVENEKTFVNESLLSFLNNRDDDKSSILTNNFTNESFRIEDTRRLSTKEHKEKSDFVDSKYNREEASSSKEIFAKSVPVKIRRNSFLETMLSDDLDTSINCAISTKTVVSSMSMNKELSISNESANKIRESDITKKNEHVCNFYNKTTKVDTENQEDTIKTKKKIIKVSSADIKSMQSENKNACNVKSDVLNELLCNFSNIKLKIVSPENKKSAVKIDDDKNIARSIAMDNGISKEKERASKSLERFKNEVCDISISAKITGINNNMAIDKKIAKQDLTEINIEKKLQELENNTYNLTIGEILKNKNTEVSKFNECCNIKNKTVNDQFIEKMIDENISNIRTEEICVKTRIEEMSIKNADEVKQDKSKKLRDICVPKTILKKNSTKCEQQQMNKFQKRIPIGAPATMNKIFDSKEFESIAVASRNLENKRKFEINSKQTHSHGKEKTDEVITVSETDDDQRRVANRSTLALLDDTMSSDDKCAIARKTTSIIPCNNNDNNKAVTPVVNISNDQSFRDVVTITPGKVRSFVKYYEIRGDATTVERHSKSKDKEKVIKRKSTKSQAPSVVARNSQPEAITEGKETIGGSKSVKSNNIHETSFNKNQFSTFIPKASADDSIYKAAKEKSKVTKGYEKSDSRVIDKKTRAPLTKTGAKKSVQFLSGFTVIHSGTFDENDSTEIVTDDEVNTLKKRRAPGIPSSRDSDGCQELIREIKKSEELPDAEKSSFQQREAIAQIHAVTNHGKNSGEEVVTVPSTSNDQESWRVQRISVNGESPQSSNRRRGYGRSQLQPVGKRNRLAPSPPTQPISYRVNVKDQLDKYFDWPNKENTPGNAINRREDDQRQVNRVQEIEEESTMGSNLSRHNGKGLTGRRTQSSGNLCEPKGKLNSMGKILVPCSSAQRERYKFCGSLPNHLDDKDVLDDDQRDNNNIMSDTIGGNFGGTLPHKKRSLGVHFSDSGPTGTLDLVKHRSQDSFDENDPWRYQQSDLDLVRCRHGNFDSVKRNRSADTVLVDSGRKYGRSVALEDRCHRNSDLDLVGTLPKRKQDARNSSGRSLESNSSSQPCIVNATDNDDLLMKIVHKPDCELLKHRQQFGKCVDLKLSKLTSGEPQDQGYASERSPEDEHPPSLPGQPFPSVTPESTFRVTLQKSSRGLGLSVSGGGTAGPVRVKRLFPQQPAALSNKLQTGDILLAANGIPLTGLTNYEALEVLRTTPNTVELVVCRLPGDSNVTPPGAPPPPPARREPSSLRLLNPLPPLQIEPCGEFDIEMTKVGGSLGFTLRKADSSALGHYVRALVREPALSDGRIRPGDKIVAVDDAPLSPMSHEEAVQLLRQCGPTVKLRLYRDLAQTPVSALSPTEPDHPLRPPRTSLRQEAVDMLCDLAVRKLSPGTSSGSSSCKQQSPGASCNSPRRLRRLATRISTAETNQETPESKLHDVQTTSSTASQAETASDSDQCSVKTQITNSQANTPATDIIDPPPLYDIYDDNDDEMSKPGSNNAAAARPSFLDLSAPQGKPHFQFCSVDSDSEYPGDSDVILAEAERGRLAEPNYSNDRSVTVMSSDEHDNDLPSEPASMPPMLSSTSSTSTAAFSYKNPAYQSANPACGSAVSDPAGPKNKTTHSSDQDIPGKILGTDDPGGSKGLLKWKGVMFAPNDEVDTEHNPEETGKDTTDSVALAEDLEQGSEVFMVELTRGWNSRLGFSLQPEGNCTVISVVHPDSVAAKDGRLRQGDVLLMVNEESVEHMSTADIIDLLRKIRGSIGITVMRRSKRDNIT